MQHVLIVSPEGNVSGLWSDALPYRELGAVSVERASEVEWDSSRGQWSVTLPDGSVIGHWDERSVAIEHEVEYLQARM